VERTVSVSLICTVPIPRAMTTALERGLRCRRWDNQFREKPATVRAIVRSSIRPEFANSNRLAWNWKSCECVGNERPPAIG